MIINKLINMDKHLRIFILFSCFLISFFLVFVTPWFFLLMFTFLGLLIYTNIKHSEQHHNNIEKSLDKALTQNNFIADDSYLSDDYLSGIAINKNQNKIAILSRKNTQDDFNFHLIDFKDIIESAIIENDETITKTSKGSAIGGAIVGGILAGGVGATIGGLSATKKSRERALKLTLSLTVDDLTNPTYEINFLNSNTAIPKDSEIYHKIYSDINKWHKTISVILKRNEKLNTQSV